MVDGPNGVATYKGDNAKNLTNIMMPAFGKGVEDATANLTPQQKLMVASGIKEQTDDFNHTVAKHEFDERNNAFVASSDSLIKNYQNDTIQKLSAFPGNTDVVDKNIDMQLAELKKQQAFFGWSDAILQAHAQQAINATHEGVIQELLSEKQYSQAQTYFDKYGPELTGDIKTSVLKGLREGAVSQETLSLMQKFGNDYALPGGKVNEVKLQADINALPDIDHGGFSPDEKIQMAEKTKGLAYERAAGNLALKDATQTNFMNQMVDFKAKGGPNGTPGTLADFQAQIVANPWKVDDVTLAKFNTLATKTWQPGSINKDDPKTVTDLTAQILHGTGDPMKAVELAGSQNLISSATQAKLEKQVNAYTLQGPPGEAKEAWKNIVTMADQRFGKDTPDSNDFKYYMYTHAQGKLDTDLVKFAKEEIDRVPKKDFGVWSKVADYNKAKGEADPGHPWLGQSANNKATSQAVKWLQDHNAPTTNANIEAVLKRHPDGKF